MTCMQKECMLYVRTGEHTSGFKGFKVIPEGEILWPELCLRLDPDIPNQGFP